MPNICLYFQVHQPNRLIPYDFFQIGEHAFYEDDRLNAEVLNRVAQRCYFPANQMFLDLINEMQGNLKITFSLSGTFLEQCEHHRPELIDSFRALVDTGCVEILAETYYHSLAYISSPKDFILQVQEHAAIVERLFGVKPTAFRNTELIYNNELAEFVEKMGYQVMLAEGVPSRLAQEETSSPKKAPNVDSLITLLRNRSLSDDLAFRRTDVNWEHFPLTADHYVSTLRLAPGPNRHIFMDYETLGEHQDADTGVFEFWPAWIKLASMQGLKFLTVSEASTTAKPTLYDCHEWTSWADHECDLSAWLGNVLQKEAMAKIVELEASVNERQDPDLTHVWRKLQTSDHFYYMSTKGGTDGDVHQHFSPYNSPYDAYIYYMNALSDLQLRVKRTPIQPVEKLIPIPPPTQS